MSSAPHESFRSLCHPIVIILRNFCAPNGHPHSYVTKMENPSSQSESQLASTPPDTNAPSDAMRTVPCLASVGTPECTDTAHTSFAEQRATTPSHGFRDPQSQCCLLL
jgi:hypothetical protein